MKLLKYKMIESPVGVLKIVTKDQTLVAILWDNEKPNRVKLDQMIENKGDPVILETEKQLNEYFYQKRKIFNLPIDANGTSFQKNVWTLLNQIPYGEFWTYKEIAIKLHQPNAARAVGFAIGRNPISIVTPCHRVIASDGSLGGFAGGIDRKQMLLDLEGN